MALKKGRLYTPTAAAAAAARSKQDKQQSAAGGVAQSQEWIEQWQATNAVWGGDFR